MVDFVEHELAGDPRLSAVLLAGLALKRRHHLLHNLVKEDGGQLRVEEGAELKGDLQTRRKREGGFKTRGKCEMGEGGGCARRVCARHKTKMLPRGETHYTHKSTDTCFGRT